jgi:hypothetical protein
VNKKPIQRRGRTVKKSRNSRWRRRNSSGPPAQGASEQSKESEAKLSGGQSSGRFGRSAFAPLGYHSGRRRRRSAAATDTVHLRRRPPETVLFLSWRAYAARGGAAPAERSIYPDQILYSVIRAHQDYYVRDLGDRPSQRVVRPCNRVRRLLFSPRFFTFSKRIRTRWWRFFPAINITRPTGSSAPR